ncbi:MAG: hypothetical protein IT352_03295 [Gemmatimonadales bacterium]|nr:hypothetical protein [Gemmatimonadales bacterium]
MTRVQLARRLGLAMGVGTLAVCAAWIWLDGIPVATRRLGLERERLARREADLRYLPVLEARGDSVRKRLGRLHRYVLDGRTLEEAQASLLIRLERASTEAGGRLESAEALPDSLLHSGLGRVLGRATVVSDLPAALEFLKRLEFGGELVLVRQFAVEADVGGTNPSGGLPLRVRVVVAGWYHRGSP